MAVGIRSRKLRDHFFDGQHEAERAKWEWSQAINLQNLLQVTNFPEFPSPKASILPPNRIKC